LKAAQDEADAFAWEKANESLRAAIALIVEGEEAAKRREKFDLVLTPLENDVRSLTDPLKGQVTEMIDKAKESAKGFDFVHATRFLGIATARLAADRVKTKALAGQVDGDLDDLL